MQPPIYLDHNATTPIEASVLEAMLPWLRDGYGNPSSDHGSGRRARRAMDRARGQVAELVSAPEGSVVFTSGGTESNNLAIFGTAPRAPGPTLVTSAIEHPAVREPFRVLEQRGHPVVWVRPGRDGRVDPDAFARAIPADTALVSLMLANNETGALQPVAQVAAAARRVGALVHTDAAQALGKVEVDITRLGVDLLTVVGHKMYAPKGVGALIIADGVEITPILYGAGHEAGIRPGTENVASIVGLGEACRIAKRDLAAEGRRQAALCDQLWGRLAAGIEGIVRTVPTAHALPNTLHVRVPGVSGLKVLARAPTVAASTGSACHAGVEAPSDVLLAMDLSPEEALGALRISVGRHTSAADVEAAAAALVASHQQSINAAATDHRRSG